MEFCFSASNIKTKQLKWKEKKSVVNFHLYSMLLESYKCMNSITRILLSQCCLDISFNNFSHKNFLVIAFTFMLQIIASCNCLLTPVVIQLKPKLFAFSGLVFFSFI